MTAICAIMLTFMLFSIYVMHTIVEAAWNDSVRILVLLPEKKGSFYFPFGMERAGAAVSIAIEHLQKQQILNGIDLQVDYVNTNCNNVYALGTASSRIHQHRYTAIIGPQCSKVCSHVGRLASYFNIACFSGVCQDTEMLKKSTDFHTLTRFLGTFDKVGLGVLGLMNAFNWERIGVIAQYHTDKIWLYTRDAVNEVVKGNGLTVSITRTYDASGNITMRTMLKEVAEVSRIIVLAVRGETLRQLMLHAYDMDMTNGNYMFICIYYYPQKNTFGDISWKSNDQNDEKAREAYKSILFMSYYTPVTEQFREFSSNVKNRSNELFNYQYGDNEEVPYPAANLYEAMYMYGVSLNETLDIGGDPLNGTLISTRLWGRTFTGITGNITLNTNGDREQGYKIEQIVHGNEFQLQIVGFYFSKFGRFQHHTTNPIVWPEGHGPVPDHPHCGYSGEFCDKGMSDTERLQLVIGSLVGVLVLLLFISIIVPRFVVRKAKAQASELFWRIKEHEILLNKREMWSLSRISLRSGSSAPMSRNVLTGYYKGILVCIKRFRSVEHKTDAKELRQLRELEHTNIVKTLGFCIDPPLFCIVSEYCTKGSLMDILENDDITLDWDFKYCLAWDVMRGLEYIFGSNIRYHGNLKSSNCVVDSRFVLKLKDFGPRRWIQTKDRHPTDFFWTAPELLRLPELSGSIVSATRIISVQEYVYADIYSLAIILHELAQRNGPFGIEILEMSPRDVIDRIQVFSNHPFRPPFEDNSCPEKFKSIIEKCWDENPSSRPTLKTTMNDINCLTGSIQKVENFFDNLLKRMEQYATNLEGIVEERTSKYLHEKRKAEDLLHRLLPQSIAEQIQTRGFVDPEYFDCVSILFTDIVEFTSLSAASTPLQIVEMLNLLYSEFDDTINEFDVYKVETIGDAYMCVSGLPKCNDYHHLEICGLAKKMMRIAEKFTIPHKPGHKLQLRAGIHSGSCVAGVIGVTMPRYCLFGDTVNTASRMESSGEGSKIQISEQTYQMLTTDVSFTLIPRGETLIKGKGKMKTYWLEWRERITPCTQLELEFGLLCQ